MSHALHLCTLCEYTEIFLSVIHKTTAVLCEVQTNVYIKHYIILVLKSFLALLGFRYLKKVHYYS